MFLAVTTYGTRVASQVSPHGYNRVGSPPCAANCHSKSLGSLYVQTDTKTVIALRCVCWCTTSCEIFSNPSGHERTAY